MYVYKHCWTDAVTPAALQLRAKVAARHDGEKQPLASSLLSLLSGALHATQMISKYRCNCPGPGDGG